MADMSATARTGLHAAQLRLDSAAHNVANLNTPGFRRQAVVQEAAQDLGGTRATLARAPEEGVALEQEAVEQIAAVYAFKANVQALKVHDEVMGSLLDTRA